MTRISVMGYGYWGPNLARNFARQGARVAAVMDQDAARRDAAAQDHPGARVVADVDSAIAEADAVVIATPPRSHREIALAALAAGKHVFVEKPLADTLGAAREIARAAGEVGRVLMVDHTFVYAPAVETLAEIVRSGVLGEIVYAESTRTNLANFDLSIGVVRDLAVHDLSILDHLFGVAPALISARGGRSAPVGEFAFLSLDYGGVPVHLHVNCISPVKIRRMVIGGTRGIVVYDDVEQVEKLRLYERGDAPFPHLRVNYRSGPISVPPLASDEPLARVAAHFLRCIETDTVPRSDAASALRILAVVEAAESLIAQDARRMSARSPPSG